MLDRNYSKLFFPLLEQGCGHIRFYTYCDGSEVHDSGSALSIRGLRWGLSTTPSSILRSSGSSLSVTEEKPRPMECGKGAAILELDDANGNVYLCKHCRTDLALAVDIISKVPSSCHLVP